MDVGILTLIETTDGVDDTLRFLCRGGVVEIDTLIVLLQMAKFKLQWHRENGVVFDTSHYITVLPIWGPGYKKAVKNHGF